MFVNTYRYLVLQPKSQGFGYWFAGDSNKRPPKTWRPNNKVAKGRIQQSFKTNASTLLSCSASSPVLYGLCRVILFQSSSAGMQIRRNFHSLTFVLRDIETWVVKRNARSQFSCYRPNGAPYRCCFGFRDLLLINGANHLRIGSTQGCFL